MDIYEMLPLVAGDYAQTLSQRCKLLNFISFNEPVGRRKICEELGLSERRVRAHMDYLLQKKLIMLDSRGAMLTELCRDLLPTFLAFLSNLNNFFKKEETLKHKLAVNKVIIVPGNADEDTAALSSIAMAGAQYFQNNLSSEDVVALTGGNTISAFANAMSACPHRSVTILPLRGSLGKSHSMQANSVVAMVGRKFDANYFTLNIPDNLDYELAAKLLTHPEVKEIMRQYDRLTTVVFSVSSAKTMAQRRRLTQSQLDYLKVQGAVVEALGYYYNNDGKVIMRATGVGLNDAQFKRIPLKILLAGGKLKADALYAFVKHTKDVTLVIDEAMADALIDK